MSNQVTSDRSPEAGEIWLARLDPIEGVAQPRTISTARFVTYWGVLPEGVRADALIWVNDFLID